MLYILAGNYLEYQRYLEENKLQKSEAKALLSINDLMGLRNIKVVRTGTWYNNPLSDSIYLSMAEEL